MKNDAANRWQTQQKRRTKTTEIAAKCSKPSACWASHGLSPAHRGKRWRRKARRGGWRRRRRRLKTGGVQVRRIRAGGFWCWLHRMETPGLACYNLANISSISHDIQSPQWRRHCIGVAWDTMGYFGTSWDQSITIYWDIMTEWGYVILCHQNDLGLSWNMGHTHTHTNLWPSKHGEMHGMKWGTWFVEQLDMEASYWKFP